MEIEEEKPDWDRIYPKLLAFAHYLITRRRWFRGNSVDSTIAGQEAEDYVQETISRYIQAPEKFDASKGKTLDSYLKNHIILTLIGNDARSFENRKFSTLPELDDSGDEEIATSQSTQLLLAVNYYFDEDIDYNTVMAKLEEMISGDEIAEKILLGSQCNMERRDIIAEFNLKESEYDNGVRRLNTKKLSVASHFNIKDKSS